MKMIAFTPTSVIMKVQGKKKRADAHNVIPRGLRTLGGINKYTYHRNDGVVIFLLILVGGVLKILQNPSFYALHILM